LNTELLGIRWPTVQMKKFLPSFHV
jgi:hypothetical protein